MFEVIYHDVTGFRSITFDRYDFVQIFIRNVKVAQRKNPEIYFVRVINR